jgi:hypothetical protein
VYVLTRGESWIRVTVRGGVTRERPGGRLDPEESRALLERRGHITLIERGVPEGSLCPS